MASSYTPLGIELQNTGENAGTWGDKTNTNLNLVQQAIAGFEQVTLSSGGTASIRPYTRNFNRGNQTFGYTAILSDSDAAYLRVTRGTGRRGAGATVPAFIGDNEAAQTVTVSGLSFEVIAKAQPTEDKTATITIVGNETGGSVTINLTIEKQELETTPGVALEAL